MTELAKDEITELLSSEMLERNLFGVEFGWSQTKSRMGFTRIGWDKEKESYYVKGVFLSEPFFNGLEDKWKIIDTLYHELAHAVAVNSFGSIGHDDTWRQIAKSMGARPEARCSREVKIDFTKTGHRYIANCPNCDYSFGFSRMGKIWRRGGYMCPACKETLVVGRSC